MDSIPFRPAPPPGRQPLPAQDQPDPVDEDFTPSIQNTPRGPKLLKQDETIKALKGLVNPK